MSDALKILLVDDDESLRFSFRTILESAGHTIAGEAKNGKDGVDQHAKLSPDITLMDMNMPKMDGLDALVAIRAAAPEACVIMLTSVQDLGVWEDCMMAGARGYIRKDTPFEAIPEKIAALWQEHKGV